MSNMLTKYNAKPDYWDKGRRYIIKNDIILRDIILSVDTSHSLTRTQSSFQTLAVAIIGQQISVAAASSVLSKLKINIKSLTANNLFSASNRLLKNSGLSRQKIEYLKILSEKFVKCPKFFYGFKHMDDEEVIAKLCELKGIGEWTAQMYLMFQLNRPNVMPMGDIGFINSAKRVYKIKEPVNKNIIKISKKWGNYKTIAVWYIWRITDPEVVQY